MYFLLKIVLVAAAFFLVYGALRLGYFMGRGHEVLKQSQPFSAPGLSEAPRILIVGDSTAAGTGAVRPEDSVAGRIAADLPSARIDNFARNGFTVSRAFNDLKRRDLNGYDLLLIQVGGNDVLYLTSLSSLKDDVRGLLAEGKRVSDTVILMPSGNVGFAPMFPPIVSHFFSYRSGKVRAIFMAAAREEGVRYVDLFVERREDDPLLADPKGNFSKDGLHPSGYGYGVWYDILKTQAAPEFSLLR